MNRLKLDRVWTVIITIGIIVCVFLSITIAIKINDIPANYKSSQAKEIKQVEKAIIDNIDNKEYLSNLVFQHSVEINVKRVNDNKLIFSSLPEESIPLIKSKLNSNAINYETGFRIENGEEVYDVWWLLYNVMPQNTFDSVITTIIIAALFMISIIIILLLILYIKFLLPLRDLKTNISKLAEFRLDELSDASNYSEYGELNKYLLEFGKALDTKINETGYKYTKLESELQLQNEKLSYQNRMIASLTHNLKAPIITIQHLIDKEQITTKSSIDRKINDVIVEINDISRIVYDDKSAKFQEKVEFNLTELVDEIYNIYLVRFNEKDLIVEFDIDEEVIINDYLLKYKQLIHNAISNIVSYAKNKAYVKIGCYVEDGILHLSFYNDAHPLSKEQLENVFRLFYRISDNSEGLGTGLYTIKTITTELKGIVRFENEDDGVILEFTKKVDA